MSFTRLPLSASLMIPSPNSSWGKLSALIVQSLRTNANARVEVVSKPGEGLRATIAFARAAAEPLALEPLRAA